MEIDGFLDAPAFTIIFFFFLVRISTSMFTKQNVQKKIEKIKTIFMIQWLLEGPVTTSVI